MLDFICFSIVLSVLSFTIDELVYFNPTRVYENFKVNWIGAWLLAIVFNVVFWIRAILYWIYVLCTFGRKD